VTADTPNMTASENVAESLPDLNVGTQRRRSVMLFADLADSVRLIHEAENDTIARWRHFAALAREKLLPAHGARLVRTAGDGLLIECSHAVQAAKLAHALHADLQSLQEPPLESAPARATLQLRIGLHVAEVLFDAHEAYGAGVNLAARLATLAQPGETVVSSEVRDQLVDHLHAELEDLGLNHLKHLSEPVRAYRASPPGSTQRQRMPHAVEDLRPSIAVIPLETPLGDSEWAALGHAVAEDVIGALSRQGSLRVLSRVSTAMLAGQPLDLPRLRELLGARYLLSGRCHRLGSRLRMSIELCELGSGTVLWAEQLLGDVESLFAGSDEAIPVIVAQVSQRVLGRELSLVRARLPLETLPSYTLYVGAQGLMNSLIESEFQRAHAIFEHLAHRHPRQAHPHAMLARWHVFRQVQGWAADLKAEGQAAWDQARRALDIDPDNAIALVVSGLTRMNFDDDPEQARALYLRALAHDNADAYTWACLSSVHSRVGEHEQAQSSAERALELSPLDPNRFLLEAYAAMAALGAGAYERAVGHAQASLRHHALHAPTHRMLVGSLWLAGRHEAARIAATRYLAVAPQARAQPRWRSNSTAQAPWGGAFSQALAEAGVPP